MNYRVELLEAPDPSRLAACFRVFALLRPHLTQQAFIEQVSAQWLEGYRIACIELEERVAAAAGFRIVRYLAWGKVLYVDDLITHPQARQLGLANGLLDWLIARATAQNCDAIHLDSGFQRHDAHRLYLNKGFVLSCHHFSRLVA